MSMHRKMQRKLERKMRNNPAFKAGQKAAREGKGFPPEYHQAITDAAQRMSDWVNGYPGGPAALDLRWKEQRDDGTFITAALPDVIDWIADSPDARRMLHVIDEQTGHKLTMNQAIWALRLCRAIPMPDGSYYGTTVTKASYALDQMVAFAKGIGATRVPETPCPHCGVLLSGTTDKSGKAPTPGAYSACVQCAGISMFTEGLGLRAVTDDEMAAMPEDQRAMLEDMRALVRQFRTQYETGQLKRGARREVPEA